MMNDELITRTAVMESLTKEYNRRRTGDGLKLAWIEKAVSDTPSAQPDVPDTNVGDTISRQAALDCFHDWVDRYGDVHTPDEMSEYRAIEELQSVEPEITRCKDCKHWMPHSQLGFDEDNGTYHDYCAKLVPEDEYYAFYRNADDFCSRAERRTDG